MIQNTGLLRATTPDDQRYDANLMFLPVPGAFGNTSKYFGKGSSPDNLPNRTQYPRSSLTRVIPEGAVCPRLLIPMSQLQLHADDWLLFFAWSSGIQLHVVFIRRDSPRLQLYQRHLRPLDKVSKRR